jgi:glycosyltransferase involved in cell wall biosynthesis
MRLTRRKRPSALLRILADLRNRLPRDLPLRAVVIGSGPQDATMARAVRRHGMDWVEFTGRLTRYEIQQLYSAADVYLAPAELESFGVAALEARCAGLGVVAMASGGVGEFVRPGVEGFLVETDAEMAAVTAWLLTSPELLRGMQNHNRSTEPAMTWQLVVEQHLAVYQQVLTQPALSDNFIASA